MQRRGRPSAFVFVQDYTDYTDFDDFYILLMVILFFLKRAFRNAVSICFKKK
jgi:hypothetical protein